MTALAECDGRFGRARPIIKPSVCLFSCSLTVSFFRPHLSLHSAASGGLMVSHMTTCDASFPPSRSDLVSAKDCSWRRASSPSTKQRRHMDPNLSVSPAPHRKPSNRVDFPAQVSSHTVEVPTGRPAACSPPHAALHAGERIPVPSDRRRPDACVCFRSCLVAWMDARLPSSTLLPWMKRV